MSARSHNRLHQVGSSSYRDGFDHVRSFAKAKMLSDFEKSHLHSPLGVSHDKARARRVLEAAGIARKSRLQLSGRGAATSTAAYSGLVTDNTLRQLAQGAQRGEPIEIMISSINVGAMAMLRSLQTRHAQFGLNDMLHVDYQAATGRDEMLALGLRGPAPDFFIAPDGAFFTHSGAVYDEYRTLTPFFIQDQYVIRRKSYRASATGQVWTYPNSSAEAMIRAWTTSPTVGGFEPRPWLAALRVEECEAKDLPAIAARLDRSDMLIAWEPLATEILRQSALRGDRDYLQKVPNSRFPNVFSLNAHERWTTPDRESLRNAVEEVLIAEWNHCCRQPDAAWNLIKDDLHFLQFFAAGAGCEVPPIIELGRAQEQGSALLSHREPQSLITDTLTRGTYGHAKALAHSPFTTPHDEGEEHDGEAALPKLLTIDTGRGLVSLDEHQIKLSLSQFALVVTLARNFTADDPEAPQLVKLRKLLPTLRGLLEAKSYDGQASNLLSTLEEASGKRVADPFSKLLNDTKRQVERRKGDEKRAAQLLRAILPTGRASNLKIGRACIRFR